MVLWLRWQHRWAKPLATCHPMGATPIQGKEVQQALGRGETYPVIAIPGTRHRCCPTHCESRDSNPDGFPQEARACARPRPRVFVQTDVSAEPSGSGIRCEALRHHLARV